MSDSEVENVSTPSGAECLHRCKEFASITQTDTAVAMFYLQDVEWNLEVNLVFLKNSNQVLFHCYILASFRNVFQSNKIK